MSRKGIPIRILLVGLAKDARWLQGLLDSENSGRFRVTRVPYLENTAEHLSRELADVLLLNLGSNQSQGRAVLSAIRTATPGVPVIILSETGDESLAVKSLQQGAQDFLQKTLLDRAGLVRALRYAIERHRLQKTLQTLSLQDDLTGLNNRRGFLLLAEQHLRMILRKGAALLIYLDVDGLKKINDTYGHVEGNRVLIVAANVLRACFRQSDIIGRMSGDEFCVLMTDANHFKASQVRRRLQNLVDYANSLLAWRFRLSLSVGIINVPAVRQPALDNLLHAADSLMYEQKRNKRESVSFEVRRQMRA